MLTTLTLKSGSDYLDLLSSHLDAPLLKHVNMEFVRPTIFDFTKISQFIGRKESFEEFDQAQMLWDSNLGEVGLRLSSRNGTTGGMWLELRMEFDVKFWHLCSLAQVHHPFAWLEFLRFFTAVGNLYLSESIARFVVPVPRELAVGESAATARDVLPALQTLFVEGLDLFEFGPVREAIGEFVAARKLSDHPVAIHRWVGN